VSLVEQLTQVMKQNSAVVMLALQREYSPTCSQSNFSSAVASDKQANVYLKICNEFLGRANYHSKICSAFLGSELTFANLQ